MAKKEEIYQHFSAEDQLFIDQTLALLQKVEDYYSFQVTAFINPHQAEIAENLAKRQGLKVFVSSHYVATEQVRVILAPGYYELDLADFGMDLLEISYPSKFAQLSHGQILGTLLNRLGIERRIIGDILVTQGRAQLFVDQTFSQLLMDQIKKIARTPVSLKKVGWDQALVIEEEGREDLLLLSSLRLDKLVATSYRLSRSDAVSLISSGRVKVNYALIDNPSQTLKMGDLVSVRGFGRLRLKEEKGLSKSGKYKVSVALISSK